MLIRKDMRTKIRNDYFEWLFRITCENKFAKDISYRKLLELLHRTEFVWMMNADKDRADAGINLRWEFACDTSQKDSFSMIRESLRGPCSMLEMLVALARKCEEIMDNPENGDRTKQWFWSMVTNLGLGGMSDDNFDDTYINDCLRRFMHRTYKPDGKGGLFTIKNCRFDLRTRTIWTQLCWYLDSI